MIIIVIIFQSSLKMKLFASGEHNNKDLWEGLVREFYLIPTSKNNFDTKLLHKS